MRKIRIFTSGYQTGELMATNYYLPNYHSVDIEVTDEQFRDLSSNNCWSVTILGVELLDETIKQNEVKE